MTKRNIVGNTLAWMNGKDEAKRILIYEHTIISAFELHATSCFFAMSLAAFSMPG